MTTTKKPKPEKKTNFPVGIKAKTEIGKSFIVIAYLTFVGIFVTQFIGNRHIPTILETLFTIMIVIVFYMVGILFLNSAEKDENTK